jgi:integrase
MASISTDANGNVRILFVRGKKRHAVRLGKITQKTANEVKLKVEHLNALLIARLPMDGGTAAWVAAIGDELAAKLAAVGLIPERRSETLGEFLNAYLDRRRVGAKPNTVSNIRRVVTDLLAVFDPKTGLRDFTADAAERFRAHYLERELAPSTVHRQLKFAKTMFTDAVKRKLIPENPFADVKTPNKVPTERRAYIPPADAEQVIAAANPTWRIIVALSRFAGLRCPSETLSFRWADVNFETNRMTVPSPKTEHIPGKEYRVVPIFAALRPHLEEAFELAEPGTEFVVSGPQADGYRAAAVRGWKGTNLRSTMLKLVRRAGLKAYPKPFHNLRASCETDLMQHHPIHVVTAWLGNTPSVAIGHYLQTLESDFRKAVGGGAESGAPAAQNRAQTGANVIGQEKAGAAEVPDIAGVLSEPVRCGEVASRPVRSIKYTQQESNLQPSVP